MRSELHLEALREAAFRIRGLVHRTPCVRSGYLSRELGAEVYLKLENQQRTGSFKPRGALVSMLRLSRAERQHGVITISAGNHAQGVAYAGRVLEVPTTVVMPAAASRFKAEAARGYGAEVVLHGDMKGAFARLEELRAERGLAYLHPFDSPGAVLGQASVGLEILEQLPGVDLVVVGIGGGGLAAGVGLALKSLRPEARVVGVEPVGAAAMARSLELGSPQSLDRTDTIADGLAAPFAGSLTYELVRDCLERVVLVDDAAIRTAMRVLFERVKTVAEPAGAAALAALLEHRLSIPEGGRVVAVVSGGNIGALDFARLLGGAEPGA